jgi:hypothetical protein
MKHLLSIAFVIVVAGCGGGGDRPPGAGTPAPSQGTGTSTAAQIDGANYLDAFAIGTVALSRAIDAAQIVGIALHGTLGLDTPGGQDCWAAGALEWHEWYDEDFGFRREYTSVNHPCLSGGVELRSGIVEFVQDHLTLKTVVWRQPPDPTDQMIDGQYGVKWNSDGAAAISSGVFFVQRNGRLATYMGVSIIAAPAAPGSPARATSGSLQVCSAPFAPQWLTVAAADAGARLSVTAPDGTRVVITEVAGGTTSARRFEVFATDGSSPVVTQTLTMDDPLVIAAMARAQG